MPLTSGQERILKQNADLSGSELVADAGIAGRTEVDRIFAEALGEPDFASAQAKLATELNTARTKFHATTVAGTISSAVGYVYDPTGANLNVGTFDPSIKPLVFDRLTTKEAKRIADSFLTGGTDMATFLTTIPPTNPELTTKFQNEVVTQIKGKVDAQRSLIETSVLDHTQFKALIAGTTNPQLKVAYESLRKEKFATEIAKEKSDAEQATIQTNADTFEANVIGTDTDLSTIADKIINSPGYASFPDVVKNVLLARLNVEKAGYRLDSEVTRAQRLEIDTKKCVENLNRNLANLKLWVSRLKWIGGGLLIAGAVGAGGSFLLAPTMATVGAGSVATFGAANWVATGLAATAGAFGANAIGELADKGIKDQRIANAEAATKFAAYDKAYNDLAKKEGQRDVKNLQFLANMGATIASMNLGLDQKKAAETYVKKLGLSGMDELLK